LVLRQGMTLAGAGIIIGWVAAQALRDVMPGWLHDIKLADPLTFALALSVLSCWLPARRAKRVDPMEALRYN